MKSGNRRRGRRYELRNQINQIRHRNPDGEGVFVRRQARPVTRAGPLRPQFLKSPTDAFMPGIIYAPPLGWYTPLLTLTHTPKLCSPIGGVCVYCSSDRFTY